MAFAGADDEYSNAQTASAFTQTEVIDLGNEDESKMNDTNSFFCFHCSKNHLLVDLFMWSNCNHHYSRDCALFEIKRQLYDQEMPKCVQDKSTIPTYLNKTTNNNDSNDNNKEKDNSPSSESPDNENKNNNDNNDNKDKSEKKNESDNTAKSESKPTINTNTNTNANANTNTNTNSNTTSTNTNTTTNAEAKTEAEPQVGPCGQYLLNDEASTLLDEETYREYVNQFRQWRTSVYLPNKSRLLETSNINDDNSPFYVLTDNTQNQATKYEMKVSGVGMVYDDDDSDSSDENEVKGNGSFGFGNNSGGGGGGGGGGGRGSGIVSYGGKLVNDNDSSSSEADVAYNNGMTFGGSALYDTDGRSIEAQTAEMLRSNSNEAQLGDYDEKRDMGSGTGINLYDDSIDYMSKISSLNSKGTSTNTNMNSIGIGMGGDMLGYDFAGRMRGISMGVSYHEREDFTCQHCNKQFRNLSQFEIFEWCPFNSPVYNNNYSTNNNNSNNNNSNNNNNNGNTSNDKSDNKENKENNEKENKNDGISGRCGHLLSKQCAMDIVISSLFSQQLPSCPCKKSDGKTVCGHFLMENEAIKLLGMESELFDHYAKLAIEKNAMDFDDYNNMAALSNPNSQRPLKNLSDDSGDDKNSKKKNNDNSPPKSPQKLRQSFTDPNNDGVIGAVVNAKDKNDENKNESKADANINTYK